MLFGALGAIAAACGEDSLPDSPVIGGGAGGSQTDGGTAGNAGGSIGVTAVNNSATFNALNPAGAGGNAEFPSEEACVGEQANTQPSPVFVEFLVDTSLSMAQSAQGGNEQPSKWEQTRDVLVSALAEMPEDTAVGLAFYPDVPVNSTPCFDGEQDVILASLGASDSEQRSKLANAFAQQDPDGSTPTHDAYVYSLTQLEDVESTDGRFVVLITDGEPTFSLGCEGSGLPGNAVETEPLIAEAGAALTRKVRTFVIGSPGSEDARSSLSQMAEAGGTAPPDCSHDGPSYCHFDMTQESDFAQALGDALRAISGQTLSCSYDVPTPPNGAALDPEKVNVVFTRTENDQTEDILKTSSEGCTTGWKYSDDGLQIILCPATCERITATPGQLSLAFGCETKGDLF